MSERGALASIGEVLQWRATKEPSATAFTWLGDAVDQHLTYAELDRRARGVAALLQREGPPGERALLLFAPGLDFIAALFGCFYAGWIAVPAYPPPLNQRLGRIQSIAMDAEPRVALTSASLLDQLKVRVTADPHLARLRWQATDRTFEPRCWSASHLPLSGDVAVLQYTSGSTAAPRGVVLSHANLLHNAAQIEQRFDVRKTPASQGVIWLPPYHDMGLIGGILEGVYAGFPVALMAPVAFLQRPRRWLEAITRTRATISGGPNFAYDLCVERIPPAQRAELNLSSWKVAFNGSEPVRGATLQRFSDAFASSGFRASAFYPCYGLAEATLMVSGGRAADPPVTLQLEDHRAIVGCGRSLYDQSLVIVDPTSRVPRPTGQSGEIWLAGPSVAAGYWRNAELTESVFQARLNPPSTAQPALGGYLRTGDLGFLDERGELFVTGRLKAVLLLGGRKIQAEELEATLREARPTSRPGGIVALGVDADGEERLVIVYEFEPRLPLADHASVVRTIRLRIAEEHQVPVWAVVLTRRGGVPRTSSGKVQRAACQQAFLNGQLAAVHTWRSQTPTPRTEGDGTKSLAHCDDQPSAGQQTSYGLRGIE